MGLHSIFEGFQQGLLKDSTEITSMFVIIILHKWNEAYQMGSSLRKGGVSYKQAIVYVLFYSLLTPIGIAIGKPTRDFVESNK
jgi:zinc transporter ZupT